MQNNSICVATFFVISKWLMTYQLLKFFEDKPISWKVMAKFFYVDSFGTQIWFYDYYCFGKLTSICCRLTPLLAIVILFNSTLMVHLFRGPIWDSCVAEEYRNCRKNWWTNLLYINNFVDRSNTVKTLFISYYWHCVLYFGVRITLF